jgi:hypothetical protein
MLNCFFGLSAYLTENTISVMKTNRGKGSWMYVGLNVKLLLFLSTFNQNWNVLTNFSKNPKYEV